MASATVGVAVDDGPAACNAGRPCAHCTEQPAKYRCPACDTRTCSLTCTKAHKQHTGCTGKRSRTEMVTLADFTEAQLLSDYKFLEEAARLHDVAQRSEAPRPARQLPHGLQMFTTEAKRRDIQYELLPPGMQRRKLNSSRFDRRSRTISWHVEWQFPAAGETVHDQKVSEQTPLQQVLQEHLKLAPGNSLKRHALRLYAEAGMDKLHILMRKEHCPVRAAPFASPEHTGSLSKKQPDLVSNLKVLLQANQALYHQFSPAKFLRQLLAGKVVIEYPTLIVLLPHEIAKYNLAEVVTIVEAGEAAPTL